MLYTGTSAETKKNGMQKHRWFEFLTYFLPKQKCDNRVLCSILNRLMSLFPKYATKTEYVNYFFTTLTGSG